MEVLKALKTVLGAMTIVASGGYLVLYAVKLLFK